MKERTLKVYNQPSLVNYDRPNIVLQGLWLKEAGFNPGDKIKVSYQENQIHITLADPSSAIPPVSQ